MDTIIKDGYHKMEDVYKNVPPGQRPSNTASNSNANMGNSNVNTSNSNTGNANANRP
jgi:hypothetical protein